MVELRLKEESSVDEITTLLEASLKIGIVPHADTISEGLGKGIYFWFIKVSALPQISKFVEILTLKPSVYKEIEGVKYVLIYLGTAGTGREGNSNLAKRLEWHINQKHTESNICHGTLSTLRAGLGALLSNDLILPNAENDVNTFIKDYMKVFWIEYSDDKSLIDNDEKNLIKVIRPLLNIKNNPNAKGDAIENPTKAYRRRRNLVATITKQRIRCKGEDEKIMKKQNPTEFAISYQERIVTDDKLCIEYTVLQGEDIAIVTRGINELPLSEVSIKIFDSKNPVMIFDLWKFYTTGNNRDSNAQNIFKYFSSSAPDRLKEKSKQNNFSNNRANWIKWWMFENEIEEITVRVCSKN
jgi:hypothetical protein